MGLAGPENKLVCVQGGKQTANPFLVPAHPTLHWDLVFECLSSITACREVPGQPAASIPWIAEMWFSRLSDFGKR